MAKYKQIEFAELCGIKRGQVSVYVSRGKLIIEDELLDENNPINQMFIQKCLIKRKEEKYNEPEQNTVQISDSDEDNAILEHPKREKGKRKEGNSDYAQQLIEMNKLKNEKLEEEIELLKKRNMKMDGEAIPTVAVLSVISFFGKSYTDGTNQLMDNVLNQISQRKALTAAEHSEFRGMIIKGINEVATRANRESKKNIDNIIREVSISRGVGEHD